MPAPRPAFQPPFDIHLMRGQTIQLEHLLEIEGTEAADYIDAHANIKYNFSTSFPASNKLKISAAVGNASSRKPTCKITLDSAAPTDTDYLMGSFVVYVTVTDTTDSTTAETGLRIHVHDAIEEIWMTPNPFTVYQGIESERCALYALFKDGVVAEIGDIYEGDNEGIVDYKLTNKLSIKWISTTAGLVSNSGKITPGTKTGNHIVKVEVKYGTKTVKTEGEIRISDALTATQAGIKAEKVATGCCPGFAKLNEVPNILFLPEGFKNKEDFEAIVLDYVSDLVSKKISAPFDLLKGSINFWKAFVPSRESGITYRGTLGVYEGVAEKGETGTPLRGYSINSPLKPTDADVNTWSPENLMYVVPLPLKSDETISDGDLRKRWEKTTLLTTAQLDILFDANNSNVLVMSWKSEVERRLPDAKDTAFGISVNDYNAIQNDGDHNLINFDKRRVQREFLDLFLGGLKDTEGNAVGSVFVMDKTTEKRGKDYDNIIFIIAGTRGREQNEEGYLFVLLHDENRMTLTGTLADKRVSEVPVKMLKKLSLVQKATLTHELCHSFGLGDEYGETPDNSDDIGKPVTDAAVAGWDFATYKGAPAGLDEYSNVQAKKDMERPKTSGGTEIDAFKVKWRYHRIQKCSLVSTITASANELTVTLKTPTVAFAANEVVFLRKRRINRQVIVMNDKDFKIEAIVVSPGTLPKYFIGGYHLKIKAIDAANHKINLARYDGTRREVELLPGQTAFFRNGQRVYLFKERASDAIQTTIRIPSATAGQPDTIGGYTLSKALKVKSRSGGTVTLEALDGTAIDAQIKTLNANEEMLLYATVAPPEALVTNQYKYAELTSKLILDYLNTNAYPLNANAAHEEIIDEDTVQTSSLPKELVPCCSRRKKEIVGIYSGGTRHHGEIYHPTAQCLMRTHNIDEKEYVELCAVCRYTLVNMINPLKFGDFDKDYLERKIYPEKKTPIL